MGCTLFYHAGCPDGFGAAWSAWRAMGDEARYVPRGHDDPLELSVLEGEQVIFADISPQSEDLRRLGAVADRVVVLDHHISARDAIHSEPGLAEDLASVGHLIHFDLGHSGAVLAWQHFHPGARVPDLLCYVEDQDLWTWKLPSSEEVNAAIGSYARNFDTWDALASRPWEDLAREGEPIVRARRIEVQRALHWAHPVDLQGRRVEAVNAQQHRSHVGHELAKRAAFGEAIGLVYRVCGSRVDVSLYSIGQVDVCEIASRYSGGGHLNAAGFSVGIDAWWREFGGD